MDSKLNKWVEFPIPKNEKNTIWAAFASYINLTGDSNKKNRRSTDQPRTKVVILGYKLITMVTIIKKGTPKEEIKKKINEAVYKATKRDIKQYAGALKMDIDPLEYQKQIRDEW